MSQFVDGQSKTFTAGAAIAQHLRVKLSSSKLAAAGATDLEVGTLESASFADLDVRSVRLRTAAGTTKMVAAGAISADADVWGAAGGKINDVANGNYIGKALGAASGDGSVIEVERIAQSSDGAYKTVEAHTADDTLTVAESGSVHTSFGAAGTVILTLPAAVVGLEYFFQVGAAQELRLEPNGTETISLPSTGVAGAAGKYLTANAAGETVHLVCANAGTWAAFGFTGTWTAEA